MKRSWQRVWAVLAIVIPVSHHVWAGNERVMQNLAELDVLPALSRPVGTDRVSKHLILTSDPAKDRLTRALLERVLTKALRDRDTPELISAQLAWGDGRLARALLRAVGLILGDTPKARDDLQQWAAGNRDGMSRMLEIISSQPLALRHLSDYMLATPEDEIEVIAGLSKAYGATTIIPELIQGRLVGAVPAAQWQSAAGGLAAARWVVAEKWAERVQSQGALYRKLKADGSDLGQRTLYRRVWQAWLNEVSADPLLVKEYVRRGSEGATAYKMIQEWLGRGLGRGGERILASYLGGSEIAGSRYAHVVKEITPPDVDVRAMRRFADTRSQALRRWSELVLRDREWCDFLLWHLTRPAIALGMTTLEALALWIEQDVEAARTAADTLTNLPIGVRQRLEQGGADTPSFRSKRLKGTLTAADWKRFGNAYGKVLVADEEMSEVLFTGQEIALRRQIKEAMSNAVPQSSTATRAWLETMIKMDPSLRDSFLNLAVAKGRARDRQAGEVWLQRAAAQAASPGQGVALELGQWKELWGPWVMSDEGWDVITRRLELELWGVTWPIRKILENEWSEQMEAYQRWRTTVQALPQDRAGTIVTSTLALVNRAGFAEACLEAARNGDVEMLDLVEPIWTQMLRDKSGELVRAFQRALIEGVSLGEAYSTAIIALDDAMAKNPQRTNNLLEMETSEARRRLRSSPEEARPMATRLLADRDIWLGWRGSLYSALLFGGRGRSAATVVAGSPALTEQWRVLLRTMMTENPAAMETVMRSLARQRAGDLSYQEQLREWEKVLAQEDARNLPMWEQWYADPTGGYRETFLREAEKRIPNLKEIMRM